MFWKKDIVYTDRLHEYSHHPYWNVPFNYDDVNILDEVIIHIHDAFSDYAVTKVRCVLVGSILGNIYFLTKELLQTVSASSIIKIEKYYGEFHEEMSILKKTIKLSNEIEKNTAELARLQKSITPKQIENIKTLFPNL